MLRFQFRISSLHQCITHTCFRKKTSKVDKGVGKRHYTKFFFRNIACNNCITNNLRYNYHYCIRKLPDTRLYKFLFIYTHALVKVYLIHYLLCKVSSFFDNSFSNLFQKLLAFSQTCLAYRRWYDHLLQTCIEAQHISPYQI